MLRPLFSAMATAAVMFSSVVAEELPRVIELEDQHEKKHVLKFPSEKVTILTIADRHGREQISTWLPAIRDFKNQSDIYGLADAKGTPSFMKSSIRKRIGGAYSHPLLIDWSGDTCAAIGYRGEVANILIVNPSGTILNRFSGPATPSSISDFRAAMAKALSAAH